MVTIRDVAREAGVSTATVSRALNQARLVTEKTRRRVLEAVQRLDYRPNAVARGLSTRKTRTIGLVVSDIMNPFYPEVARGVEDVTGKSGYSVILCNTDRDPAKEAAYINLLLEKRVQGVVFASLPEAGSLLEALDRSSVPWISAGNAPSSGDYDCVAVDNVLGAYLAAEHLLKLGHTRIAHITGPLHEPVTRERLEGFRRAAAEYGLDPGALPVVEADYKQEGGYTATLELFDSGRPVTAVFAGNDLMAIGALEAAHERGLRVPGDLAIVGFDDISIAGLHTIQLTTVAQPKAEIGRLAAEMLLERIEHPSPEGRGPNKVVLPPRLVVRRTCGAQTGRFAAAPRIGSV